MNSFSFGLWTGFVAGFVFTALMKQSRPEPSMEEKLLGPHATGDMGAIPSAPVSAPKNLADALAQQSKMQD